MRVMMSRLYSGVLVGVLYTECAHRPRTSWHTNARYKHAQTTTVVGFECVVRVQWSFVRICSARSCATMCVDDVHTLYITRQLERDLYRDIITLI